MPSSPTIPMPAATRMIFEQLNRMLLQKSEEAGVLRHNLERGLSNEQALRSLLREFLPAKYGVAKGKVINSDGEMSDQCDIIVYDGLHCPKLFIDENQNQLLPIEGVYAVVEVKTTLNKSQLEEAFENLHSVYRVAGGRYCFTNNEKVDYYPPSLDVLAFTGTKLTTLKRHFDMLSHQFPVANSFSSYSIRSPGYKDHNGRRYLVHRLWMIGNGAVFHMLNGSIRVNNYDEYTLGMFLTGLVNDFEQVPLPPVPLIRYLNYLMLMPGYGPRMTLRVSQESVQRLE